MQSSPCAFSVSKNANRLYINRGRKRKNGNKARRLVYEVTQRGVARDDSFILPLGTFYHAERTVFFP